MTVKLFSLGGFSLSRTLRRAAAWALLAGWVWAGALAQTPASAPAPTKNPTMLAGTQMPPLPPLPRSDGLFDYLPDFSQVTTNDVSQGRVRAFYSGAALMFFLTTLTGLLWKTRQQNQHVRQLKLVAKELEAKTKFQQRDFFRKQQIHFENTPLVVVELDASRKFKDWSGRAETVFGWRAMEVIGRACDELPWVDPRGVSAVRAAFAAITSTAAAGRILTLRHQARNGEPRQVEWHITVLPAENGIAETVLALGLDVTEREVAAATLRREQKQLALAVEAGSAGLWSLDPADRTVNWGSHLREMLGYEPEEFPTRVEPWLDLFHPEDRPRMEDALSVTEREVAARQTIEARVRHRDGSYKWFRLGFVLEPPVPGKGGAEITGTATDLTRLKLAEEKFRGLVEQSLAGIFILQENRVVYANPKFWAIVRTGGARPGLRPEFLELVHPEDRAMVAERLRPLHGGTAREAALLFRVAGPQGYSVAVQGHGIASEHEGEPAILGLVMDVSHRFAQEQTSRRLSQVVEQSPVAILITNPDGVIEYANRKFCEVSGYAQEELLGRQPQLLKSSQTPDDFYKELWTRLRQGKKWEGEYVNRAKDGRQFTVRANLFPIFDEGGAVTHCVEIMEDITSQRSLEERLARAQRLESIGNLAGGIAHDLNNILAPIRMGAEFLKTLPFSGKEREIVEVMDISIHRATELVQQVLAFSRGRSAKREVILLPQIIGELERLVRESFPRDVRLELNIAPDLAPVKADATQILQVLMNLCVNSRDALPAGGLIVLTADNVTLGSTQTAAFPGTKPGEHVRIRVRDNGTGIPAEVLDKIFEPFFTTKDVGKGTGLGLSTALGIVQEHAGIIELESTGQQGTTFVIYLPATTETPTIKTTLSNLTTTGTATPRSAAPSTTSGKGVTVLVVDDEAPLRQAVSLILGQRGYKVLEAPDGAKAIEMVRELGSEVDVVLLDVMMPRMDGVATLKALREVRNNLRVIATSGVNHDSRVEAMRKLGVQHFLLKPYRNQDLVDALEECLSSKSGV